MVGAILLASSSLQGFQETHQLLLLGRCQCVEPLPHLVGLAAMSLDRFLYCVPPLSRPRGIASICDR